MGIRPPIVRRAQTPRAVRPIPERTGPYRTPDRLLRTETAAPGSPIGDAVSQAYQVFDRYLKEGKEYAAGQSAWYNGAPPAIPGTPAPADLLAVATWLVDQLKGIPNLANAVAPFVPTGAAPVNPVTPASWPKPRWPSQIQAAPARPAAAGTVPGMSHWVEETFDDDDGAPAKKPHVVPNVPPMATKLTK